MPTPANGGDNFDWVTPELWQMLLQRGRSAEICRTLDACEERAGPQRKAAAALIAKHIIWRAREGR